MLVREHDGSLWRIQDGEDSDGSNTLRHGPAASRHGWSRGEGRYDLCYPKKELDLVNSFQVAYIDTEGTFRPERIQAIAERFEIGGYISMTEARGTTLLLKSSFLDGQLALDNIVVGRALNSDHRMSRITFQSLKLRSYPPSAEMELINILAAKFAEDPSYRLLIVDSIMALFRVDYSGRGELSERQQKLNQMLSRLTRISEEYNVAVFITNQVQADPGASSMFVRLDTAGLSSRSSWLSLTSLPCANRLEQTRRRSVDTVRKTYVPKLHLSGLY